MSDKVPIDAARLRDRLRMLVVEGSRGIFRHCKADGAADAGCIGKPANAAGAEKPSETDPPAFSTGLSAAVADERYWRTSHPENGAWRAWVSDGFQALYGGEPKQGAKPAGGVVHVRAYVRNGQPVAAHTRGAPPSSSGRDDRPGPGAHSGGAATSAPGIGGYRGVVLRRRNLLEDSVIIPAMAKRPDGGMVGGPRGVIPEGGGGGGTPQTPGARPSAPAPQAPPISPRSRELVDMIAPGGQPIGVQNGRARPQTRTLPGGQAAAEAMLGRLIQGRGAVDITPRGHPGRMYRLDDGTVVGYRPLTSSGSPSIDINIPGFTAVRKFHF